MQLYDDYQYAVYEISYDQSNPMPVYADLRDEGIYIAFAEPFGVILTVNGEDYLFPWTNGWLTPRGITPRIYLSDFDEDGDDELAVVLYVLSGTGLSVEELHIVEFEGSIPELAISITGKTIKELLYNRIIASYDPTADEVEITIDDQTLRVDVSPLIKEHSNAFRGIDLESVIQFDSKDGKLTVSIIAGLIGPDYAIPIAYVSFYADIIYRDDNGNSISLENCRIEPWSW